MSRLFMLLTKLMLLEGNKVWIDPLQLPGDNTIDLRGQRPRQKHYRNLCSYGDPNSKDACHMVFNRKYGVAE